MYSFVFSLRGSRLNIFFLAVIVLKLFFLSHRLVSSMRSRGKHAYHGESILKYFTEVPEKRAKPESNGDIPLKTEPAVATSLASLKESFPQKHSNAFYQKNTPPRTGNSQTTKLGNTVVRKCPGYKWIADTPFTVDAFRYGLIPGCQAYFLSHFHYDHYGGLTKAFSGPIYCSQVTKGFLQKNFGTGLNVTGLELNQPHQVCGIEVVVIDANHCPGSVMFLIHIPAIKRFVLHTGDFRFTWDMLASLSPLSQFLPSSSSSVQPTSLHCIYLDTTYCAPQYDFESQQRVISSAVQVTRDFLSDNPTALIVCGMYSIGKERFVYGLATELNLSVWLPRAQHQLVHVAADHGCRLCQALLDRCVSDRREAQLHIASMNQINISQLTQYSALPDVTLSTSQLGSLDVKNKIKKVRNVLAWRPTGWSHVPQKRATVCVPKSRAATPGVRLENSNGHIFIYGAAYSEHSSFCELRDFVTNLRPQRVQPTVFGRGSAGHRNLIDQWLKPKCS
ncbi:putative dna cross-link repair protein pso2/snm1 [Fasciola hepatica]|uniref:Dna cross-link repair protein pso2/snm1 n=1 Tax=Fasciola hepatica TaxID=6192 RepID=A0A4E0REY9_FASHE|nr:putative dna cross-link repair protein pso2/snm1 [Fasciola hepatica]